MERCPLWTVSECEAIERMAKDGATNQQIADALGRSIHRVAHRARMYRSNWCRPMPSLASVAIPKAKVIEFYELGWRFVGFNGDLCMFEWQSEREPRWPEQMREAA